MADDRRPRANPAPSQGGFDIWLPAFVAILAAIFMVLGDHAQTAPQPAAAPRAIFDPAYFDAGAIDRQAAAAAIARGDYLAQAALPAPPAHLVAAAVVVAPLPDIVPPITPVSAMPLASAARTDSSPGGIARFLAIGAIGTLLAVTVLVLVQIWRRTSEPRAV